MKHEYYTGWCVTTPSGGTLLHTYASTKRECVERLGVAGLELGNVVWQLRVARDWGLCKMLLATASAGALHL